MNNQYPPNENPFLKAFIKLVSEKVPIIHQPGPETFESTPVNVKTTFPPGERVALESERTYRHNGVHGWKIQGYDAHGNVILTIDVYKQIELHDLQALNPQLGESKPTIGSTYRVRRSNGTLEKFIFQGLNPSTGKLMMVKPDGGSAQVNNLQFARENFQPRRSSLLVALH
jgi:hypothetical protein